MTSDDHLPALARAAHTAMLAAWDALADGILAREGREMEAELLRQGHTGAEAAQGAAAHVARLMKAMRAHRACLEAAAVRRLH